MATSDNDDRLGRAKQIATELRSTEAWRTRGNLAVSLAGALLSAIPGAGGPLQVLCEKVGGRIFDAKLETKFTDLCDVVAALEPELKCLDDLDAQISGVVAALEANLSLHQRVAELLRLLHPAAVDVFGVKTVGGLQEFVKVTVRDMNVLVQAHQYGINLLKKFRTQGGNVQFDSSTGGYQRIEESTFEGSKGGQVGMDKLTLSGRVAPITHQPDQPGIGLGEGGSIAFGPGGQLSFGPGKKG